MTTNRAAFSGPANEGRSTGQAEQTRGDGDDIARSAPVRCRVDDGVLVVTLDAPETGNALTVAMTEAFADVLERVDAMTDVHCVLVRSSGRYFSTGGNVKDMERAADLMAGSVHDVRDRLAGSLHRVTRAFATIAVPTIAAVNGPAVGAGCDVALMCDLRIAGEEAQFAESFLRLGLVSGIGGAWFLTRIVGVAKALELTLTSEFIDAGEAETLGIVSRVVPQERLDDEAMALARRIAASPPRALRLAKRLVLASAESPLSTALELAASMQAILLAGDEHAAAVGAFNAKRAAARVVA